MTAWNFATVWEIAADNLPDALAVAQGDREITWGDFDRRADALAHHLLEGAQHQDKIALYLYNCPEYLEGCFAAFKAGLVPVNTNYRYASDELVYLWDNADATAVIFHGSFGERIKGLRDRVPSVRHWLWVDDGHDPCPDWATPYERVASSTVAARAVGTWGRGEDDLLMLYTGGTTGMPKGVMWRQDDMARGLLGAASRRYRADPDYDQLRAKITRPGKVGLPACPLMHGTGWFNALAILCVGGCVALLEQRHFDVEELLGVVQRRGVNAAAIVGDTFAKPMVAALDAEPGRWDISTLAVLSSSGVMWSEATKTGLLRHNSHMQLVDNFSSSEALGMGQSVSTASQAATTAKFRLGENARVIDDDGHDVKPGSGRSGRVAVPGFQPIGYYKDPEKSARTFVVLEGKRYSMPGDYAMVEADGTLTLLGRGSVCINTGGEKVFPEEVEEALKTHPLVHDAVVVGVPDDRFGEAITAVVEPEPGANLDESDLIAHVKERLAGYKAPKRVVTVTTIGRAPNAKVDYKRLKQVAMDTFVAT